MGERNEWVAAMKAALALQSEMLMRLHNKVDKLEKFIYENTKAVPAESEVIQGITGTKYVAQVFKGPDNIPHKVYPDRTAEQPGDAEIHGS